MASRKLTASEIDDELKKLDDKYSECDSESSDSSSNSSADQDVYSDQLF